MSANELRKQLLRGGVGSFAIKAAHTVMAFLLAVLLARVMGPAGYGVYSFALALIMVLAVPAQMGVPQITVRETAKSFANADWNLMYGLWRWSAGRVLCFSLITIIVAALALYVAPPGWSDARQDTVFAGLLLVPLLSLSNVVGGGLRGLGRVVSGQLPENLLRSAFLFLFAVIGALLADAAHFTSSLVMTLHIVAGVFALSIGAGTVWFIMPASLRDRPVPRLERRYWRRASMPLAMSAGIQLVNAQLGILALGVFQSDSEVGVYRVVVQLGTLVVFGLQALNQVLQPYFARFHAQEQYAKLERLVVLSARTVFIVAVPPVLVFTVFGESVLTLLFGHGYATGTVALAIMSVGQLVNAAFGSVGILLNMTGHERDTLRGVAVAAAMNALLNAILVPWWSVNGAAVAMALSLLTWNVLLRRAVIRRLGIEPAIVGRCKRQV